MQGVERSLTVYHMGYLVCISLALVFLAVTLFLGIRFQVVEMIRSEIRWARTFSIRKEGKKDKRKRKEKEVPGRTEKSPAESICETKTEMMTERMFRCLVLMLLLGGIVFAGGMAGAEAMITLAEESSQDSGQAVLSLSEEFRKDRKDETGRDIFTWSREEGRDILTLDYDAWCEDGVTVETALQAAPGTRVKYAVYETAADDEGRQESEVAALDENGHLTIKKLGEAEVVLSCPEDPETEETAAELAFRLRVVKRVSVSDISWETCGSRPYSGKDTIYTVSGICGGEPQQITYQGEPQQIAYQGEPLQIKAAAVPCVDGKRVGADAGVYDQMFLLDADGEEDNGFDFLSDNRDRSYFVLDEDSLKGESLILFHKNILTITRRTLELEVKGPFSYQKDVRERLIRQAEGEKNRIALKSTEEQVPGEDRELIRKVLSEIPLKVREEAVPPGGVQVKAYAHAVSPERLPELKNYLLSCPEESYGDLEITEWDISSEPFDDLVELSGDCWVDGRSGAIWLKAAKAGLPSVSARMWITPCSADARISEYDEAVMTDKRDGQQVNSLHAELDSGVEKRSYGFFLRDSSDASGKTKTTEKTVTVSVDADAPKVFLENGGPHVYPVDGKTGDIPLEVYAPGKYELSYQITDAGGCGIESCSYFIWKIMDEAVAGERILARQIQEPLSRLKSSTEGWTACAPSGSITIPDSQDVYLLLFRTRDRVGNEAVSTSGGIVIDTEDPVVDIRCYTKGREIEPGQKEKERIYCSSAVTIVVTVKEHQFASGASLAEGQVQLNVDISNAAEGVKRPDCKEQAQLLKNWSRNGDLWTFRYTFAADAGYRIRFSCRDLAGRRGGSGMIYFTVDRTPPTGSVSVGAWPAYRKFSSGVRFCRYSHRAQRVKIFAQDQTSPVRDISYLIAARRMDAGALKASPDWKKGSAFRLRPDRRCIVYARLTDQAGNIKYLSSDGIILDDRKPVLTLSIQKKPSEYGIYDGDVPVMIDVRDPSVKGVCSGLAAVSYEVKCEGVITQEGSFDCKKARIQKGTSGLHKKVLIDSGRNASNRISFRVTAVDRAGNVTVKEIRQLSIDTAPPEISVSYEPDTVQSSGYYSTARTACITVRERNFRAEGVKISITNSEGTMPMQTAWTEEKGKRADDAVHSCRVVFAEDGDYTFSMEVTDAAGNRAVYGRTDRFTIDRTAPVIQVTYDNNRVKNDRYYNKGRTAVVRIREHNFREEDVRAIIRVQQADQGGFTQSQQPEQSSPMQSQQPDQGSSMQSQQPEQGSSMQSQQSSPMQAHQPNQGSLSKLELPEKDSPAQILELYTPTLGKFTHDGDIHTAVIHYPASGDYTFTISYTDPAGNRAEDYGEDSFTVDLDPPVVWIKNIEKANKGSVCPVVEVQDAAYDRERISITLTGARHPETVLQGEAEEEDSVIRYHFPDLPRTEDTDDVYTLKVCAADLAGNKNKDAGQNTFVFSVNRFGSLYALDDTTEKLTRDYYTKEPCTLEITEKNTTELQGDARIICSRNGELRQLIKGQDYHVEESEDLPGNEPEKQAEKGSGQLSGWHTYRYHINQENFREDGIYTVTVYSRDGSGNASSNQGKNEPIEFAVDRTAPSIVLTGIEDNGRYAQDSQTLHISAGDNMGLASLVLKTGQDGREAETIEYTKEQLYESGGEISCIISGSDNWQTITATAADMAGNTRTVRIRVLITANHLIQWYKNKPLFFGSISAALFLIAAAACLICRKKRKTA